MKKIREMTFKISPDIVAREIGDEVFIYHNKLGTCFGLEGISLGIWEMICGGKSIKEIIETIQKDYDVDEAKAGRDVETFVYQLVQQELAENNQ